MTRNMYKVTGTIIDSPFSIIVDANSEYEAIQNAEEQNDADYYITNINVRKITGDEIPKKLFYSSIWLAFAIGLIIGAITGIHTTKNQYNDNINNAYTTTVKNESQYNDIIKQDTPYWLQSFKYKIFNPETN